MNARVWTGDPLRPWADALAVRGGLLATVGSSAEVRKAAPATARVVDARGALVLALSHTPLARGAPASFVLLEGAAEPVAGDGARPSHGGRPVLEVVEGRVVYEEGATDWRA